jgi:hypothetical protein
VAGCSIYAYVPPFPRCWAWAGDLNARLKGIANCTKAQVSDQLLGRVWSKGPLQFHQTLLSTESVDWFVRLLKDWLSLYHIRFSTFGSHPPTPGKIWGIINIWDRWSNSPQGLTCRTSGNSSDKVQQDSLSQQAMASWNRANMQYSPPGSEDDPNGNRTTWDSGLPVVTVALI